MYTEDTCSLINGAGIGVYECIFTVEPTESMQGEYWISVQATDNCGNGCTDNMPGLVSLYLNPEVSLTISSQDAFGFMYDVGGDLITQGPYAGDTVYTPYFTVENSAAPGSGLYMLLQMYGEDMWDYEYSAAVCPTTNMLDVRNIDYKASHLNVQQPWTEMYRHEPNKDYIFDEMLGNFIGIGDDVTMRLRLNIPNPCEGNFDDGGEIVFVGQVI